MVSVSNVPVIGVDTHDQNAQVTNHCPFWFIYVCRKERHQSPNKGSIHPVEGNHFPHLQITEGMLSGFSHLDLSRASRFASTGAGFASPGTGTLYYFQVSLSDFFEATLSLLTGHFQECHSEATVYGAEQHWR